MANPMVRTTWFRLAIVVVAVLLLCLAWLAIARSSSQQGKAADSPQQQPPPSDRIGKQCDSGDLIGPSTAPAGAVTVDLGSALDEVVSKHPAGSTYWLVSGMHRLSPGKFAQVVPKPGDTFVGAPGAVLDGEGSHLYAFGGSSAGVTIRYLTVQNFGRAGDNNDAGVVNHDSATRWTVEANTIQHNAGAGVMVGSENVLTKNCLRENGQYGFSAYHPDGVVDILLQANEIVGNNTDDWEARKPGCGCTGGGKFWETRGASVVGNFVHENRGAGLWADTNNVGFLFRDNVVSDNDAEGIMYETSYNAAVLNNTFQRNGFVKGPSNPGFATAAIYISESGSDPRVKSEYSEAFTISGNRFIDNWSGVVGWENADRFAGSPANTSSDSGTLVNPRVATPSRCADPASISKEPYIDDCRWKTQNLLVERNIFQVDVAAIPGCRPSSGCGLNGLYSNYGTYPKWSPYKGTMVEENVTYRQNNVWRDNAYIGDWAFMALEAGRVVTWTEWRSVPISQDDGSRFN